MIRVQICGTALFVAVASCLPAAADAQTCPSETAQYRVEFDAVWSVQTHPQDYPPGPHFSGLVGAVHGAGVSFWSPGALASEGIERMAEAGSKTPMLDEIAAAVASGAARASVSGGGINPSPGSVAVDFEVSLTHPLLSLVSMIAPSPDWFVGVSGVALLQDGDWVETLTVELPPFDAGTDSGTDYVSSNQDTNPPQPIAEITGAPFLNEDAVPALGSFRIERISAACADADEDGVSDDTDNCTNHANALQLDTDGDDIGNACDPDLAPDGANDCQVDFEDLSVLKAAFFALPGASNWNPDVDFNGDERINFADLGRIKEFFFAQPGPSATGCN